MDTSIFANINWLAVIVSSIAYFALGALWYSFLFQKQWISGHKVDMTDPTVKEGVALTMISTFILIFVIVTGLAILIVRLDLFLIQSAIKLGLLTGIAFSATAVSINYLYLKKPMQVHFIDGSYHIAGQILAAIILCLWR
jgi:hypothetical protein